MKTVRILIADDHQLILNGISDMLRPNKEFRIVGRATNGEEAVSKALKLKPDLIFMDISMPIMNGIDATRKIKKKLPAIHILALTQHEEKEYVTQMLKAGGSGYLLKNSKKDEFVEAIELVMNGNHYLSRKVSEQMISDLIHSERDNSSPQDEVTLTRREKEIIVKISEELSNQEIAEELHISLRTVETHRRNIMQKLKVKSVVSLLKYAARRKIISFH
ncbi:MAG: response regulator transcription factor [Bacteroidales bacterium]|nr:response regulator transcription factor [Bacteroidales bacterium]MCF6342900.1 response regulator transcription factor [Bacteroidales bacterium]